VHPLPADLREALSVSGTALDAWKDITPLARNEFICWVEDAKRQATPLGASTQWRVLGALVALLPAQSARSCTGMEK
jgi:Bacteriocin-protection, YdeI or OmpD-Associated